MFRVTFGEHDRCDKSQRPFTRYLTKIISKDFSLNDLTDDIALLKLSSPVTYSHAVRPVCLPKNPGMDSIFHDKIPRPTLQCYTFSSYHV